MNNEYIIPVIFITGMILTISYLILLLYIGIGSLFCEYVYHLVKNQDEQYFIIENENILRCLWPILLIPVFFLLIKKLFFYLLDVLKNVYGLFIFLWKLAFRD